MMDDNLAITAHSKASEHSRDLCDLIANAFNRDGNVVPVKHYKGGCNIGSNPILLYVYHQKESLKIYLYCAVDDIDGLRAASGGLLNIEVRNSLNSPWAKITPYFVRIGTEDEARAASKIYEFLASKPRKVKSASRQPLFSMPSEDEVVSREEGEKVSVYVNRYEGDSKNRSECIKMHGTTCSVCGFDFGTVYGDIGRGFIHVHHLRPLSQMGKKSKISPKDDLRPVCPNCHEMLHSCMPPLTIEALREIIRTATKDSE